MSNDRDQNIPLREGIIKKGGINPQPTTPRPAQPPKPERPAPTPEPPKRRE